MRGTGTGIALSSRATLTNGSASNSIGAGMHRQHLRRRPPGIEHPEVAAVGGVAGQRHDLGAARRRARCRSRNSVDARVRVAHRRRCGRHVMIQTCREREPSQPIRQARARWRDRHVRRSRRSPGRRSSPARRARTITPCHDVSAGTRTPSVTTQSLQQRAGLDDHIVPQDGPFELRAVGSITAARADGQAAAFACGDAASDVSR